ncbi:hypothetical protein ALNOE001_03050 [Candidatus Methanobinarius endosymbioticus]|uniref:Uncharacterized protein n=1 Tax=Candidatus Methanobinarius endosymbioticus TaxID=2006182 RepID=A0A366MFY6_9EURY|nr:hypothetical protein ALNOE001_03050 [Candidatus Methanobinarius endosymbioticus]
MSLGNVYAPEKTPFNQEKSELIIFLLLVKAVNKVGTPATNSGLCLLKVLAKSSTLK